MFGRSWKGLSALPFTKSSAVCSWEAPSTSLSSSKSDPVKLSIPMKSQSWHHLSQPLTVIWHSSRDASELPKACSNALAMSRLWYPPSMIKINAMDSFVRGSRYLYPGFINSQSWHHLSQLLAVIWHSSCDASELSKACSNTLVMSRLWYPPSMIKINAMDSSVRGSRYPYSGFIKSQSWHHLSQLLAMIWHSSCDASELPKACNNTLAMSRLWYPSSMIMINAMDSSVRGSRYLYPGFINSQSWHHLSQLLAVIWHSSREASELPSFQKRAALPWQYYASAILHRNSRIESSGSPDLTFVFWVELASPDLCQLVFLCGNGGSGVGQMPCRCRYSWS